MDNKKPTEIYFETKKQPFDITIDNNKKEPKLSKNVRYSDKQNYRRYKTLTEPKLLSRIMVDANDSQTLDIQEQIQRLLGLKPPQKKDERLPEGADVFTAPSAYIAPPNPKAVNIEPVSPELKIDSGESLFENGMNEINDVSRKDQEDLLGTINFTDKDSEILSQQIASLNSQNDATTKLQEAMRRSIDRPEYGKTLKKKRFLPRNRSFRRI